MHIILLEPFAWKNVMGSMENGFGEMPWLHGEFPGEKPERMLFSTLGPIESMDFLGPKALNELRSGFSSVYSPSSPWSFVQAIRHGIHDLLQEHIPRG
jgi:hypothetical protein